MAQKQTKANKEISFSEMRKEWWEISRTESKARTFLLIWLIIYGISYAIWIVFWILWWILWIYDSIIFDEFMRILWYVIEILSTLWIISISLDFINWIYAKVNDYFKAYTWDRIRKYFLWTILVSAITAVWFVFLIIPWMIAAVRLKFAIFSIIDKWLDPVEAIKYSRNITKWHFREIVWFDLYFLFFNFLWLLCIFIWLIRTIPMAQLATARYYRLLSEIYEENKPKENKTEEKKK